MSAKPESSVAFIDGDTSDRELIVSRVLDAPRELVWKVWTDPAHVREWWGPDGFTTDTDGMDVRVGGIWQHTMRGPDGTVYPNFKTYLEVVEHERLVWDHGATPEEPRWFRHYVTFETVEGSKTRVTMRAVFDTRERFDALVNKGFAREGARQHMNNLVSYAESLARSV